MLTNCSIYCWGVFKKCLQVVLFIAELFSRNAQKLQYLLLRFSLFAINTCYRLLSVVVLIKINNQNKFLYFKLFFVLGVFAINDYKLFLSLLAEVSAISDYNLLSLLAEMFALNDYNLLSAGWGNVWIL